VVTGSVVTNNTFGTEPAFGTNLRYGVVLTSGSTRNLVANNVCVGVTTFINDLSTGNIVRDNIGPPGAVMPTITGATPTIRSGVNGLNGIVYLTQTGPTNVTNFLNGYDGQRVTIVAGDNNSTIVHNPSLILLKNSLSFPMQGNDTLTLVRDGSGWREISRSSSFSGDLLTRATARLTNSGTSQPFSNIPSWVRRITVIFAGVSTNGSSNLLVQVGNAGVAVTTGYVAQSVASNSSAVATTAATNGFPIFHNSALLEHSGHMVLTNLTGNLWAVSGQFTAAGVIQATTCGGFVDLPGVLNFIRVATANGTDTFDSGLINIIYE
jgi:hypothetical protein